MGAASHLGIDLREYDARIRTFIPGTKRCSRRASAVLAASVTPRSPLIVDLGTGTGALAERCLAREAPARIVGVDEDEGMLAAAAKRLRPAIHRPCHGSFESVDLPACDAVTASPGAAPHADRRAPAAPVPPHPPGAAAQAACSISADCYLASTAPLARRRRAAPGSRTSHALHRHGRRGAYLRAWAKEDHYAPLRDEIAHLERAGFTVDMPGAADRSRSWSRRSET